jgi:hypothetical protein
MAMYGEHPPLKLAKDPSDSVWFWFICNGPHGERFSWVREFSHTNAIILSGLYINIINN